MDKKSKILIVAFAMIVTASTVATFNRYIVLKNISFHTDQEAFRESLIEDGLLEEDDEDVSTEVELEEVSQEETDNVITEE